MKAVIPKIKHLNMRMTLYFSLVMMAALTVIVIIISQTFSGKLISEMNIVINQKINLITSTLDNTLQGITALQFSMIHDKNINALMKLQSPDPKDIEELQQDFSRYKQINTHVTSIFAISHDGKILDPLYSGNVFQWIVTNSPDLTALKKYKSLGIFSSPNSFPLSASNSKSFMNYNITYYGQYYDYKSYEYLGYIAINLKKNSIFSDISSLCKETFDFSCFIDDKNNIVQAFGDNDSHNLLDLRKILQAKKQVVTIGGNHYLLYSQRINTYPGWTFIGLINYQQITSNMFKIYKTVFTISIIGLLLIIFFSFYIASRVTTPIRKLSKSMNLLGKGIWPEEIHCHTHDEIKELVNGFNNLVLDIKNLTEKIVEEQEAKKKIEVSMVRFQLDLLQSQINPHFIHNTLNTMNYMAKKAGLTELEETITSFNALLRTSISQNKNFITVMEEIDTLKNYMNIQKHRYDIKINFVCEVDPETKYALLPKLILQPLVENALFHGIVPKNGGLIKVSVRKEDNELEIMVEDDGAGMQEDVLNLILQGMIPNKKGFNNIGLSNVNERLCLYYSDRSKLRIVSIPDQGTQISFHIPFSI
jgi:Predicted signal transduction protein with a C-terminal ATPase domain